MKFYSIICQVYSDSLHYNNYDSGVDKKTTGIIIYVIVLIVIAVYFFNKKKDKKSTPDYTYIPTKNDLYKVSEPEVSYEERGNVGIENEYSEEDFIEPNYNISAKYTRKVLKIGYEPDRQYDRLPQDIYPQVLMPKDESFLRLPAQGRSGKKGYTEDMFFELLNKYFGKSFQVLNDKHLSWGNIKRAYEPDFVIMDMTDGKNLVLDIEIDEPYDGIKRSPMHIIGEDNVRNHFFVDRGWIVIRFAEIQIYQQPISCCRAIAMIISQIDNTFIIPDELLETNIITRAQRWDKEKAWKWSKEKYREHYLGIDSFSISNDGIEDYAPVFTEEDAEIEKNIPLRYAKPKKSNALILERNNPVDRDRRLLFDEENHRYFIDNNPDTKSVSQVVDMFFPKFDTKYWAERKAIERNITIEEVLSEFKLASDRGHYLHKQIEHYFNETDYDHNIQEFDYFLNFITSVIPEDLEPYRTEWRIFDEDKLLAGTVDMVFKDGNNDFHIYDWKRSKHVVDSNGDLQLWDRETGFGDLVELGNNSYNKYSLQQNMYKYILETKYGIKVSSMNLVIFHPNYDDFHLVEVEDMRGYVRDIYNSI